MDPDRVPDITPDLSPEDEAAIRDLLGSLGSQGPAGPSETEMPAAVRARLDDVIAEQAVARSGSAPGRNVRRLAVAWLGAAAAVAVALAGISVVSDRTGAGGDSMSSESTSATDSRESDSGGSAEPEDLSATKDQAGSSELDGQLDGQLDGPTDGVPVIRPGHVGEDAAALQRADPSASRVAPSAPMDGCVATRPQRIGVQVFSVRYRGKPAVLILKEGPPRTASVWSCADTLLESAELPD